jgi:hypothetical protein
MAFFRLYPINGENDATQRSPWLDERLILLGHGGDQRQKDLAQPCHLFDGYRKLCFRVELASNLGERPVLVVAQFPNPGHDIVSKGLSTQGQPVFLVRTVHHGSLFTSRMTAFPKMAHHFDVLVESHDPPLLVVSRSQSLMTCGAVLPWRKHVQLPTVTSVPWCSHEVRSFFDLMIPPSHS